MIHLEDVTYAYTEVNKAVDSLNIRIAAGEVVGLVGANGAGKSTLLKLLCGILQPQSGTLTVDDVPMDKNNLALLRQKVGFVFQNPDDQLFMPTVYEDIAFGLRNAGDNDETVAQKVQAVLEQLNITHLANRAPYKLSGGEKRTAAMAGVLAMEPAVLLFDEPTAFLDLTARRHFIDTALGFRNTILLASHDFELILALCTRVVVLNEGTFVGDGSPRAVLFDKGLMEAAGLETPKTYICEKCKRLIEG